VSACPHLLRLFIQNLLRCLFPMKPQIAHRRNHSQSDGTPRRQNDRALIAVIVDGSEHLGNGVVREKLACSHTWLWAQDRRRKISVEWMRKRIQEVAARAGHKDNPALMPHSLRHWFAHNMMRKGADVTEIQKALGHSALQTTWTYLQSTTATAESMRSKASFDPRSILPLAPAREATPAPVPAVPTVAPPARESRRCVRTAALSRR